MQRDLTGLLTDIKDELKREREQRQNTEEELRRLRDQFKELVEEMTNQKQLRETTHPDPNLNATPPTPPAPIKSLLIGTSLLRNVNSEKLVNCEIIAKGGAKVDDISKILTSIDQSKQYKEITLVAGSIDLESGSQADLMNAFKAFTVCASDRAVKVNISSVLPRTDKPLNEKIEALNNELKNMCDNDGYNFIDHDPTFHMLNGQVNSALLEADGLHLSQAGLETLIKTCGVETKGSPYTARRYAKTTEKTLFRGHKHPLSNFYEVKGFRVFGKEFNTSEAAYQHEKACFLGNENMARKIQLANTGIQAKQLGSKLKSNEEWQTNKTKVMETIIKAKLTTCKDSRDALLHSGTSEIVENTGHPFWACGIDGNGQNMMGKILMMYRKKMREDPRMFQQRQNTNNDRRWATRDHQPRCYRCGEAGHVQDHCRHLQDIYCWTCGLQGHKQKLCHAFSNQQRSNY